MAFLASQLAVAAATTLAKKTFEFSIVQSLNGLSDVIRKRFSTSRALQDAQAELEVKVRMLVLPMDILAHFVTRGNTALQEALGVALGVLEEVEAVRLAVVEQHVKQAQDAAASPETNAAQLIARLRGLVARLDGVLPYLNLAVATAALLQHGGGATAPSPSRLMAASWRLRSNPGEGAAVFCLEEASWHEERFLRLAAPRMAEVFPLCSLAVCRCCGLDFSGGGGGGSRRSRGAWGGYELLLQQDLNDGTHHEPGESAATLRLQVADVVAVEWETLQSLHQVENEYRPALVLHVLESGTAGEAKTPTTAPPPAGPPPPSPASSTGDRRTKPGGAVLSLEDTAGKHRAAAAGGSPLAATPWTRPAQACRQSSAAARSCAASGRARMARRKTAAMTGAAAAAAMAAARPRLPAATASAGGGGWVRQRRRHLAAPGSASAGCWGSWSMCCACACWSAGSRRRTTKSATSESPWPSSPPPAHRRRNAAPPPRWRRRPPARGRPAACRRHSGAAGPLWWRGRSVRWGRCSWRRRASVCRTAARRRLPKQPSNLLPPRRQAPLRRRAAAATAAAAHHPTGGGAAHAQQAAVLGPLCNDSQQLLPQESV